jgi:hypothetical protein
MPVQTKERNRAVQSGEKSDRKNLHVNIAARKFAAKVLTLCSTCFVQPHTIQTLLNQ